MAITFQGRSGLGSIWCKDNDYCAFPLSFFHRCTQTKTSLVSFSSFYLSSSPQYQQYYYTQGKDENRETIGRNGLKGASPPDMPPEQGRRTLLQVPNNEITITLLPHTSMVICQYGHRMRTVLVYSVQYWSRLHSFSTYIWKKYMGLLVAYGHLHGYMPFYLSLIPWCTYQEFI